MPFFQIARVIFLLLIVSLPLMQPSIFRFSGFEIRLTEIFFLASSLAWLLGLIRREIKFRFHKIYFILAFYFLTILISACFSENPAISFYKTIGVFYLLCLTTLTVNLVTDFSFLKKILTAWTFAAMIVVGIALITFVLFYIARQNILLDYTLSIYGAVPVGNYPRVQSTLISAALLANFLTISSIIIFLRYQTHKPRTFIFYIFSALIIFSTVVSISSVIGGLFLAVGLWIFYVWREKKILLAKISFSGGIISAMFFFLLNIFALQPHPTAPYQIKIPLTEFVVYPSSRLLVWSESFNTFFDNPFFGRGIGLNSCRVLYLNTDGFYSLLTDAHNIYLSLASQVGVFGLAALIVVCLYGSKDFYFGLWKKNNISPTRFGLGLAFFCGFIYQGIFASFEDSRHIWILLGLIAALDNFEITKLEQILNKKKLFELLQKSDIVLEH